MRQIAKGTPPTSLTHWVNASKNTDTTVRYSDLPGNIRGDVLNSLIAEQGGICVYTGRRIKQNSAHIEHLKAQAYCSSGEDVAYANMVACYPAPNTGTCPYGAHQKGSWPDPNNPAEAGQFVSPLTGGCEKRFHYAYSGRVKEADGDEAAQKTIEKLKLNHVELTELRKAVIRNTLAPRDNPLSKAQAETRLKSLQAQTNPLDEFHFVIIQQLARHIHKD